MCFSSLLDDVYAIGNDDSDAAHGVVNCQSIRHLLCAVFILIGERRFALRDRLQLEFRAAAFNATKSVVFAVPANVINAAGFGVVPSAANTPRQPQIALKLSF
jgi:hypothetical protein